VHIPSINQAGGFTITSTPEDARPSSSAAGQDLTPTETQSSSRYPYLELAVQVAPSNAQAAWFWKPKDEILGQELVVRVGGKFVWPPRSMDEALVHQIKKAVFIAGGVGIK